jgi:hypothetical protein
MNIISEEAYALGKMIYGQSWREILPRGCYPSDFEMIFDNRGSVLFGEADSKIVRWEDLDGAQLGSFQSAVRHGNHCAVICKHDVTPADHRKIDSRHDIVSFQAMVWDLGAFRVSRLIEGNEHWQNFVKAWYRNPHGLRGEIIERSTILDRRWI